MSILHHLTCVTKTAVKFPLGINLFKPINCVRVSISSNQNTARAASSQQTPIGRQNTSDWTIVYRLPMVRWASAFNRLKLYQSTLTVVGIPGTFVLEQSSLLPIGSSVIVGAIGISGIITLALCSLVVKNLIGFIYINQDMNCLKFAYVDYWGRRQDIVVDINDLVPDGAQDKPTRSNFYQIIGTRTDEKLSFKLLQRYGIISKPDLFSTLFY